MKYNTEYNEEIARRDFSNNGEEWILRQLTKTQRNTFFDVGCNIGEWTKLAREIHSEVNIHCFDISPITYQRFLTNVKMDSKLYPNGFGLSDETRWIRFKHSVDYPAVSTTVLDMRIDDGIFLSGLCVRGDEYMVSRSIPYIDFLKIDVEGHEDKVLSGFLGAIKNNAVGCIQFEYGMINIVTKWMLIDAYRDLEPLGYKIGKLTNGKVLFKDYHLTDENFEGSNYICVHETRPDLLELFS